MPRDAYSDRIAGRHPIVYIFVDQGELSTASVDVCGRHPLRRGMVVIKETFKNILGEVQPGKMIS